MKKFLISICALILIFGVAIAEAVYIDTVDIGDPTSEASHNLYGWGPIEPFTHGGSWGGAVNCRVISSGYTGTVGMSGVTNNLLD